MEVVASVKSVSSESNKVFDESSLAWDRMLVASV